MLTKDQIKKNYAKLADRYLNLLTASSEERNKIVSFDSYGAPITRIQFTRKQLHLAKKSLSVRLQAV